LFGYSPEEKRWTYVNAGGVPDLYSGLQLAWRLRSLDDDEPMASDRLGTYLAAARQAGQKLKATIVRPATSPENAARQSVRLLELVESCNSHPVVVLKAVSEKGFDGQVIWDVMLSLGLRWGDMDLFHWENPGIPGDDHLFSVWTSTPPGYFFPEEIAGGRVHTSDLVFGFSVPRTWQPDVVVESMLRAIHYAERRLEGRALDTDGSELSEEGLKKEVRDIAMTLTEAGFPPASDDALYLF
jgi:cell division protein ZipA